MTFEETTRANDSPAKDIVAMVLLGIAAIGGIVAIFFQPFGFGAGGASPRASSAITISVKHRALGLMRRWAAITLCLLVGASFAVWDSNALY